MVKQNLFFPKSSIHSDIVQNLKEKAVFMEENKALTVRRLLLKKPELAFAFGWKGSDFYWPSSSSKQFFAAKGKKSSYIAGCSILRVRNLVFLTKLINSSIRTIQLEDSVSMLNSTFATSIFDISEDFKTTFVGVPLMRVRPNPSILGKGFSNPSILEEERRKR